MKIKIYLSAIAVSLLYFLNISEQSFAQDSSQQSSSEQILLTTTTWNGTQLEYPHTNSPEISAFHLKFTPGTQLPWHRHPVPTLAYILKGELEVTVKESGQSKIFKKGDAVTEVINTWHSGKTVSDSDVELIVFYVGVENMSNTELLSEVQKE